MTFEKQKDSKDSIIVKKEKLSHPISVATEKLRAIPNKETKLIGE